MDSAHHRKTFQPQTMFKSAPFLGFTDWPVKLRKNPQQRSFSKNQRQSWLTIEVQVMGSKDQLSEAFNSSHGPSFVDGGGSSFFITFFINSTLSSLPSRNSLTLFILKKKKKICLSAVCVVQRQRQGQNSTQVRSSEQTSMVPGFKLYQRRAMTDKLEANYILSLAMRSGLCLCWRRPFPNEGWRFCQ